ncbi:hypothetical protein [Phaffia rhodozyma]|uniref:Uncharacterized protein n=1 Tax=Phaffia rhodozyma TaxID=264483 RepID=A0A0F7SKG4_PHARH|nr:hypothetical protein [Phaffia rhodozyma]
MAEPIESPGLDIETWCPVCDKLIHQARPTAQSRLLQQQQKRQQSLASDAPSVHTAALAAPAPVNKTGPLKYIPPIAPNFRRSKTGTIKAKAPPGAIIVPPNTNLKPSATIRRPQLGKDLSLNPTQLTVVLPDPQVSSDENLDGAISNLSLLPTTPATTTTASVTAATTTTTTTTATTTTTTTTTIITTATAKPDVIRVESERTPLPTPVPEVQPTASSTATVPTPASAVSPASLLYCSLECAKLDEMRSQSALETHLPEVLPLSPLSPFWDHDSPPYGSDAESSDYLTYIPHSAPLERRNSRGTATTVSSSESLQSLCDPQPMSRSNSSSSHHNGFRKFTPIQPYSGFPISPRKSLPISADLLLAPPLITSSSLTSSPLPVPTYNYRSSSHSNHHRASFSSVSPAPRSHHFNIPSSSSSYAHSSASFEPGSAPATASLYAEYATSFQKPSSVSSRTTYVSPRRSSSTMSVYSVISGDHHTEHYSSEDDYPNDRHRGRTNDPRGRTRPPMTDRSTSSSNGYGVSQRSHRFQITPTQSSLLTCGQPADPFKPGSTRNARRDSSASVASFTGSANSSGQYSSRSYSDHHTSPSPAYFSKRAVNKNGSMAAPPIVQSGLSPRRPSSGLSTISAVAAETSCAWSSMEKMYEIPRCAGSGTNPSKSSLGSARLFYWGE